MTLTRTDREPSLRSLVTRRGRRWLRLEQGWVEQLDDGTDAAPITWAELVDDEPVDLAIVGLTGLPPMAGIQHERRRVHGRGGHP